MSMTTLRYECSHNNLVGDQRCIEREPTEIAPSVRSSCGRRCSDATDDHRRRNGGLNMHTRTLGQDFEVSAIGLGCMGMSQSYGPNPGSRDDMIAVIRSAVDLGRARRSGRTRSTHRRARRSLQRGAHGLRRPLTVRCVGRDARCAVRRGRSVRVSRTAARGIRRVSAAPTRQAAAAGSSGSRRGRAA
jgi:hypothetical protein